ncbi:hypothetical protein ColTof4_04797 [Colletotrichum tofieldiae]|nr:hypothetical protein ColTof3_10955 [Colletotrichum tofieldiae]GKT72374.1 hypothetical protein ColTof4_04797 [Colletotrichum tofieldiae]GKT89801.1 hypothetical protein Ct61P_07651 [Colletotrichum tofieldiae]
MPRQRHDEDLASMTSVGVNARSKTSCLLLHLEGQQAPEDAIPTCATACAKFRMGECRSSMEETNKGFACGSVIFGNACGGLMCSHLDCHEEIETSGVGSPIKDFGQ